MKKKGMSKTGFIRTFKGVHHILFTGFKRRGVKKEEKEVVKNKCRVGGSHTKGILNPDRGYRKKKP